MYTKLPQNIPNGAKIHQIDLKVPKWPLNMPKFPIARPTNINKKGIFLV
jgi:hypothetical protein